MKKPHLLPKAYSVSTGSGTWTLLVLALAVVVYIVARCVQAENAENNRPGVAAESVVPQPTEPIGTHRAQWLP